MIDGYSDNQSAFPFRKTGFFIRVLLVLLNLSATADLKDVFLEYLLMLLLFKKSLKNSLTNSLPSSVLRRCGLRFDDLLFLRTHLLLIARICFLKNCPSKFTKIIDYYSSISITSIGFRTIIFHV